MLQQILPLFFIHGLSLMSPGPDVFYVLSSSSSSLSSGIRAALGIFIGNIVLVFLVLLLGTQIMNHFPEVFSWFKTLGSLYLCWLGFKISYLTFKSAKNAKQKSSSIPHAKPQGDRFQLIKGCLMCLTNPKAVLYFTSFLPQYLFIDGAILWSGVAVVLVLSLLWFGNKFFSQMSDRMKSIINFAFGLVLVGFSVLLFFN